MFQDTDEDEHDDDAIHILAWVNGEIAGCVRCYRNRGDVWYGGRLAVLPKFRTRDNIVITSYSIHYTKLYERRDSILFVTHNIEEALMLSDTVVVMSPKPSKVFA